MSASQRIGEAPHPSHGPSDAQNGTSGDDVNGVIPTEGFYDPLLGALNSHFAEELLLLKRAYSNDSPPSEGLFGDSPPAEGLSDHSPLAESSLSPEMFEMGFVLGDSYNEHLNPMPVPGQLASSPEGMGLPIPLPPTHPSPAPHWDLTFAGAPAHAQEGDALLPPTSEPSDQQPLPDMVVTQPAVLQPRRGHRGQQKPDSPFLLTCPQCGVRFNGDKPADNQRNLRRHVDRKHGDMSTFSCHHPGCRTQHNRVDNLKAHLRKVHGEVVGRKWKPDAAHTKPNSR